MQRKEKLPGSPAVGCPKQEEGAVKKEEAGESGGRGGEVDEGERGEEEVGFGGEALREEEEERGGGSGDGDRSSNEEEDEGVVGDLRGKEVGREVGKEGQSKGWREWGRDCSEGGRRTGHSTRKTTF